MEIRMTKVKISVDEDAIARGKPGNCLECPVALAMNKKLRDPHTAAAFGATADIRVSGTSSAFLRLPAASSEFVMKFDRREQVEPFEFDIHIPSCLLARY